jgi:membrane-bound metal-dependent hydrolase YbcI (DUF457 family)
MRPWSHLAVALPLAGGLYLAGGSLAMAAAAGAASVLVDVDHLADYLWLNKGRFRARSFFSDYGDHRTTKLVLLLHSWELASLALALAWFWAAPAWIWCVLGGWFFHLACDQAFNQAGWPFYFLSYRFSKGFERSRLPCPQDQSHP